MGVDRRNLNAFQRTKLALRKKDAIASQAKKNLVTSTGGSNPQPLQISAKVGDDLPFVPVNTREEVAKIAGVSRDTVAKVKDIIAADNPEIEKALESGKQKDVPRTSFCRKIVRW